MREIHSERIQVRISTKTYKQLVTLAREDKRDISTYVRVMIEKVLEDRNGNKKES